MENYEQKYKEALKVIESLYSVVKHPSSLNDLLALQTIEKAFPELRESEDERIRKELIEFIRTLPCTIHVKEEYFHWLEKQANIPHFTYDDILALQCVMKTAEKADNELYEQLKSLHDRLHDAYWLEKQGEQNPKDKYTFKSIPRLLDMIEPTDRAKSYCKKLIDSLQTEGYVTDAKIVSDCLKQMNGEKVAMATMDEQKPAWSEEDEKLYISALWHIKNSCGNGGKDSGEYEVYNWLKSIKNKVATQEKVEWNEEDEEMIYNLIDLLNGGKTIIPTKTYINWLNAIKNRAHLQLKQCDEKDEKIREGLINMLSQDKEFHGAEINWLKSLKPHWKPSQEQIEAIKYFIDFHRPQANASTEGWNEFKHLESLYNDLLKL